MDTVTKSELIRMMSGMGYNFVAFAVTPWSLHGIEAFWLYAEDRGINLKGYICIIPHAQAGKMITADSIRNLPENIRVLDYSDKKDTASAAIKIKERLFFRKSKDSNEKIYVLNQGVPNYSFGLRARNVWLDKRIVNVVIDEGMGMYMRNKIDWIKEDLIVVSSLKGKISVFINDFLLRPYMLKQ